MICDICHTNPATGSAIVASNYYPHICKPCKAQLLNPTVSSGQAMYNRGRDAEEHESYMVQPWENGKASAEFIHLYPDQSKKMFTDDEINQATRR